VIRYYDGRCGGKTRERTIKKTGVGTGDAMRRNIEKRAIASKQKSTESQRYKTRDVKSLIRSTRKQTKASRSTAAALPLSKLQEGRNGGKEEAGNRRR